jgi:hypothetical protein
VLILLPDGRGDDEMKHELQGLLRSGHPTRTEEWHDPEPTADDDLEIAGGPVAPSRSAFPASARHLADALRRAYAPDTLVDAVEGLPHKERYATVQELAEALTRPGT